MSEEKFNNSSSNTPSNIIVNVNNSQNVSNSVPRWSPLAAAILSFLIPGLGQLYKGQPLNGLFWLLIVFIGYICFIIPGIILHICCIIGAASGNPYR